MKAMNNIILITTLATLMPLAAHADGIYGEATIKKQGQAVSLSMDIRVPRGAVKSNYKMILTPYVCNGGDTLELAPVTFYGRQRYRREKQENYLKGNRTWSLDEGELMVGDTYAYRNKFTYERWMRNLSVGVKRQVVGCACDCYDGDDNLLDGVQVYRTPTPAVTGTTPDAVKYVVKETDRQWDFGKRKLKVYFKVSNTVLNPNLADNAATLKTIITAINEIKAKPEYTFKRIAITGAASPEGPLQLNRKLGAGRAKALRDYLINKVNGLTTADFELENYREDWDGLREAVAASDAAYKDKVLRVLDDKSLTSDQRKSKLKAIDGGRPYRDMLRTVYPALRSACYIAVYYDLMHDEAADAINSAVALVRQGKYAEALDTVKPYADDPRAYNTIGVCHMMTENETEAISWFHKAVKAGDRQAEDNLRQIE